MDIRIDELRQRRLRVFAAGRFVAAYTLGAWRPYVYPLLTSSGLPVTEESPPDHPHHQSAWLGQDEVNGHNLWLNRDGCGRLAGPPPAAAVTDTPDGPAATFRHEVTWQAPDGTPLLLERRVTAITPTDAGTLVDVLSERRPARGEVTLGATKEAGFGVRVLDPLDELDGGMLVNDRGGRGASGTFDRPARWVDSWGYLGSRTAGVAVFPHPENPPHPWFTRAYGIVLCNHHRFGAETLRPGERLRLQWRVVAHDGTTDEADVPSLYDRYLAAIRGGLGEALAW
ncbi:MAG: PmoA family protein [Chloroflexota bacterium]